ncbi:hypothetical protein AURDEDRAFT_169614 [Auricularia subglabra TFB-10046 SS5]|uniref:Uncharacterized protein n=1 Tax=Auricularia subglabra (strain TFB-10046 / SS5) TaxID=717982 RepID=J0WYX5_AURST|nr:hypothetical protein AURDEDRAFT_169614 [Auricularia subglabra TFB-10046 SS5]
MTAIKINTQVLTAAALMEKASEVLSVHVAKQPNPEPSSALSKKPHWMQVVVKNQTQFNISPLNPPFLDSGKYWSLPQEQEPFSQAAFGVCNRDWDPRGATGGTAFRLHLDFDSSFDFAVGWTDPILGAYKSSVVASSSAEDGYNAASPEGNSLTSDNIYQGTDAHGDAVRFRLHFSAITADHLALVVVDQLRIPETPMSFAYGMMESKTATAFVGTFNVEGIPFHFTGKYSPNVETWAAENVRLEYPSVEALTAARNFYGKVGVTSGFELIVDNDVAIRGQLTKSISAAVTVSGTGTWLAN